MACRSSLAGFSRRNAALGALTRPLDAYPLLCADDRCPAARLGRGIGWRRSGGSALRRDPGPESPAAAERRSRRRTWRRPQAHGEGDLCRTRAPCRRRAQASFLRQGRGSAPDAAAAAQSPPLTPPLARRSPQIGAARLPPRAAIVFPSRSPPYQRASAAANSGRSPTAPNRVSDERSFTASTSPKTTTGSCPARSWSASTHSTSSGEHTSELQAL